jgi:hypothetical protein
MLSTCDMQFGFKTNHSTMQCNFVMNEIVNYYNSHGSDVYIMMLDCSKAFDRVQYAKLFNILIEKNLCPVVCRLLAFQYCNQAISVKWGNTISQPFDVKNGVKQGGVLSPVLFTLYIDKLLNNLKTSCLGCHIGSNYAGALSYADDIVVMAPSLSALKNMLLICEKFGNEYHVIFNPSKYQFIHYSCDNKMIDGIFYNDVYIKSSEKATYLGYPISNSDKDVAITHGIDQFTCSFNGVNRLFSKTHHDIKYKLFKSFCMCLYGCTLWDLTSKAVQKFYTQWRICVRRLLNIPLQSHCNYLHEICNDIPVELQLFQRVIKFVNTLLMGTNNLIKTCGHIAVNGSNSILCRNINQISNTLKFSKYTLGTKMFNSSSYIKKYLHCNKLSQNSLMTIGNIKDLLIMRDQHSGYFNNNEIGTMLNLLCCE